MKRSLKNKKILITCGPTWIPIDGVRVLSNLSTGALGQRLATDLLKENANVTMLEGQVTQPLKNKKITILKFTFFDDFLKIFRSELNKKYDVVIHAAAVSDYKLEKPFSTKINSKLRTLKLTLIPTIKIIDRIKIWQPKTFLIGFKLEPGLTIKNCFKQCGSLFKNANCDLVVANSFHKENYHGFILKNKILAQANTRNELSQKLIKILKETL